MATIRQACRKDLTDIKEMTDQFIGQDYYKLAFLEEVLCSEHHYIYIMADEQDKPMAYLYLFSEGFCKAEEILHIPPQSLEFLHISPDTKVGVYKTACTRPEHRRGGILTRFLQELEDILIQDGVEAILFTALELPGGIIPVDSVVRSVGFSPIRRLEHPWVTTDSYCPYCKKRYCTCDAMIYTKTLKEGYKHEKV